MAKPGVKLDRILRVRTLQLGLVRADEARAREKLDSEAALKQRIVQLAESVAPRPSASEAFSFIAAAHFRDRLTQSAQSADARVEQAARQLDQASKASQEAWRDQSAVEKLMEREQRAEALRAVRALEAAPPLRRNRHDPC